MKSNGSHAKERTRKLTYQKWRTKTEKQWVASAEEDMKIIRSKVKTCKLKPGYMEFAMADNYSTLGIQLLSTRRVNYC